MPVKYKKGMVGILRHPELYVNEEAGEVIPDVETELKMWKVAEKISNIMVKSDLNPRQRMCVYHYVNFLMGTTVFEELALLEFTKFEMILSAARQDRASEIGNSAKDLAKKVIEEDSSGESS